MVEDGNQTVLIQETSALIVKDMAIGRKSAVIEVLTAIEEVHHVTTEKEVQVIKAADGQDHRIDQEAEEAEVEATHETMEDQKNLRKDVASYARKEAISSEIALISSTEEEIVSKEDEVETVTCAAVVVETQEADPLLEELAATVEGLDRPVALLLAGEITPTDLPLHHADIHVL